MHPDVASVQFVGRQLELSALNHALADHATSGAVLCGPPGVGKTALMTEFVSRCEADSGVAVVRVNATRGLSDVPLGAMVAHLGHVEDCAGSEIAALATALFDHLRTSCSGRTMVLSVDDCHLLDAHSAALVASLARAAGTFVVMTLRSGERQPEDISALSRALPLLRMDLDPLSRRDCIDLARRVLDATLDDETLDELWRTSGGNPLFVVEILRGAVAARSLVRGPDGNWTAKGPISDSPRMVETIGQRLLCLEEREKDLCAAVAMCDPFPLDSLVTAVPNVAVERLEESGLLRTRTEADGRANVTFAHPIYGELALSDSVIGFTARRHRLIRPVVASLDGIGDPAVVFNRAELLESTWGAEDGDARILADAAILARTHMDLERALRFATEALRRGGGTDLELELLVAHCETVLDDDETRFFGLFENADRRDERAVVTAAHVCSLVLAADRPAEGIGLLQRRRRESDLASDTELAALHASMLFLFEGSAVALATARSVIESGGPQDGPGMLQVLAAAAAAALVEGLPELSANWAARGLELYDAMAPELRRRTEIAHARDQLVTCHFLHGVQTAEMLDDPRSVIEQYRAMGPIDPLDALMVPGFAAFWRGHLEAAAELFDQGSDMLEMTGLNRRSFSYTHRAALAFLRGRLEEGHRWVAYQREVPGGIAGFRWMIQRTDALGLAAEGDVVAASALAREGAAEVSCGNWGRTVLLHDVVRFGETSGGIVEELGELAGRECATWLDRTSHRHACAHLEGDGVELEAVSTAFEEGGLDLFAAEAAAHAAAALRGAGAISEAQRCTDAAMRLLYVVGDARTPALELLQGSLDVLTDRERRVARLAGRGLSNKEIAAQLYVSVRTVANQLQSVYAKLGIHDRRELSDVYPNGR